jgi:N-acetylglucosamine kinase-like BadF-type ATPase
VRAEAGIADGEQLASMLHACLAGADLPSEVKLLQRTLAAGGWSARTSVENDSFALLRAGTSAPNAVAVVCGAGINCVGIRADGQTSRFLSLGRISGDWGGGSQLGYETLWLAVRAEDGRGEPTALREAVLDTFGHRSMEEVSTALHFGQNDSNRVHELVPVLFAVARRGDRVALEVIERLAIEVVSMATISLRRLDLLEADVVLGGGVLTAREPLLNDAIRARMAGQAPHARVVVSEYPPVVGAVLRGLGTGVPARIESTVRAQLAARSS